MRKGYLKNTITYTIIVLSQKIFKQISEVLCYSVQRRADFKSTVAEKCQRNIFLTKKVSKLKILFPT